MDVQILQIIWFILIGVLFIGYAILDGFDLGIGSLMPFLAKNEQDEKVMLNSIGPVWDGNEVWLLTAGGALFAAFPHAYATVFSGFYLALMLVLMALIFRAVSFEFYNQDNENKKVWKTTFFLGSFLPALLFGVALGNIMNGLPLKGGLEYYGGGPIMRFIYLLRPFPLSVGLLGLAAFLMQGATYAMIKTEGDLYQRAKEMVNKVWPAYLVLLVLASVLAFVFLQGSLTNVAGWVFLAVSIGALFMVKRFAGEGRDFPAFLMSSLSFLSLWLITGTYMFPNLVINNLPGEANITIMNASNSQLTLTVMLIIAVIGVPIMLAYTTYVYRIFKGKTTPDH
jgi:cytochrome d ubiquinol oxidase subunit II